MLDKNDINLSADRVNEAGHLINTQYIMTPKEKIKELAKLMSDTSLSLDERIDQMIADHEECEWEDEVEIECFKMMIDAIKAEEATATHVREMLELYVLLAEKYGDCEIYRPLENLSWEVREVLRDERIAWMVINDTVPRIIDVLKDTVYNHETYRLLLVYVYSAYRNGELNEDMKGRVRHLLKLRILLDDIHVWHDHMFTKELQTAITTLLTADELLKIILNPSVGHLRRDPVEYTDRWEEIYYDVEEYLSERFANAPRQMGLCFRIWSAKREYLKDNYGIDWHSPAQMNPRVRFD